MDTYRPPALKTPQYFSDNSFIRKIKRRIKAPEHRFILKVPPFFAREAVNELELKGLVDKEHSIVSDAGVEITGSIDLLYAMHAQLSIPSRILMIVDEFRTGAAEELFRKAARIPWELYIHPGIPLRIRTRVRNSRIEHEGAAGTAVSDALHEAFASFSFREKLTHFNPGEGTGAADGLVQNIYLSIERNHCRVAIDTSGAHLHKRGYRLRMTDAPIRETTAAGFISWISSRIENPRVILDPMCGSGTFVIESAMFSSTHSLHSDSQLRKFLFEKLPWHRPPAWEYAKRQNTVPLFTDAAIFGADIDPSAIKAAEENAKKAGCSESVTLAAANFFTTSARDYPECSSGLILTNLPYGIRITEGGRDFFKKFHAHCKEAFPGWTIACVCPQSMIDTKVQDCILFYNGGIRVQGVLLDI